MTNNPSWHRNDDLLFASAGVLNETATAADVLGGVFEDPRINRKDFVASVLASSADDLISLTALLEQDNQDLAARICLRIATRLQVAVEAAERMQTEDPEPPVKQLCFVAVDDAGNFDFEHAEFATESRLTELGWVRRGNVAKAVEILLGVKTEGVEPPEVAP